MLTWSLTESPTPSSSDNTSAIPAAAAAALWDELRWNEIEWPDLTEADADIQTTLLRDECSVSAEEGKVSISCNVVSSFVNSQPGVSLLHTAICQTPAFIYTCCGKYTNVSPKIQQTTTQLHITMLNMSTNYQSSCTDRLVCKFDTQCDSLLKLDLHLPQY